MKIHIFVQARLGSTRLKNKILKDVTNKTSALKFLNNRLQRVINVDKIVYLIPTKDKHKLSRAIEEFNGSFFCGSEKNVLSRYYNAAKKYKSDVIIRITSDCILSDPKMISKMINIFNKKKIDYLTNNYPPTFPDGFDVEIFNFKTLKKVYRKAKSNLDKEHVTLYIKNNFIKFKSKNFFNKTDKSKLRCTLDYKEDLYMLKKIIKNLKKKENFFWSDVAKFLEKSNLNINKRFLRDVKVNTSISNKLWQNAKKLIPTGNNFLSKNPTNYYENIWPAYFSRASKKFVWDLDNKKYIDFSMMGVGTNSLGYGNKNIDRSVIKNIKLGNMSSLNAPEEVYLSKKLLELHPWANQCRYTRTGAEANAISIRLARAFNKKNGVVVCGYHGWHDWYLSANLNKGNALNNHLFNSKDLKISGVPKKLSNLTFSFEYNDFKNLKKIIKSKNISCVIMEVKRDEEPKNNFLKKVRKLCTDNNIVLIFDECTSGFRETYGGIHLKYRVYPDLAMFGKSLGNGFAINAVVGKKEIMSKAKQSFMSSTFWSERIGYVAALNTLAEMKKQNSWKKITKLGLFFRSKFKAKINPNFIQLYEDGIIPNIRFRFNESNISKKTFIFYMINEGYLVSDKFYVSTTHTKKDILKFINTVKKITSFICNDF